MFKLKTFLALILSTACIVSYLYSASAYANDQAKSNTPIVAASTQIDINKADAAAIAAALKGVGLKKAEAIVQYRKDYGPFHDAEELTEVKGIGPSILKKNLGVIVVQ